jgi:anaerobic selenocysteine-containing dehydrogenase
MPINRRKFLTLMGGTAVGAVLFQACGVPEDELFVQSPIEMPEDMVSGLDNWYATLCRQCPTSEGIVVRVMEGRAKKIEGNVDYPINRGKHSARCEASLQALYHPDRISAPLVRTGNRGSGQFDEISWTDAIGRLSFQLKRLQDTRSQKKMTMITDPVSAHLGMVVERFVSKYGGNHLGQENLERTTLSAAIEEVFLQKTMPDFDIEHSNYILSFGADFLNTWGSPVRFGRGYGEFRQGSNRERGTMVHVESRFSMTAANADRWIYVNPGMEGILALSIAQVIVSKGLGEPEAVEALTGKGRIDLDQFAPERVTDKIGVPPEKIEKVAVEFAQHRPSVAIGGGSAAAHTNGLFNLKAIFSLNYLVGSVNEKGGIIYNPEPILSDIPIRPVVSSFTELQNFIQDVRQGDVEVLLVRGANPFYGLPAATGFEDALLSTQPDGSFNVPFIFSFSEYMDDTSIMADLILPVHNALEDWGSDVPVNGPGYQVVGFQQPVIRPFFDSRGTHLGTRGFGDILLEIARQLELDMGIDAETFKEVLEDGAKQLYNLPEGSVAGATDFQSFWHGVLQRGGWWNVKDRVTGTIPQPPELPELEDPVFDSEDVNMYPLHLIPFASASLTDGKGAFLPWLQATPDPLTTATWQTWVEINVKLADKMDIKEGDVVKITSRYGNIEALAFPHPGAAPDSVSIPIGQGHRTTERYAGGRGSNVLSILSPSMKDSSTGSLAWAATRVRIEKTENWIRLPKFENTVPDFPRDENQTIIKLTTVDS